MEVMAGGALAMVLSGQIGTRAQMWACLGAFPIFAPCFD